MVNLEKGGSSRQTETVMSVLQDKKLLPAELRIPTNSTVNKFGLALDQLTIKHGLEFIQNAVELRLGIDASTTRNKHVLAAGLKNEKNEFFGLGFIESPGHDAESMFHGYTSILKRYDFEGSVPKLKLYMNHIIWLKSSNTSFEVVVVVVVVAESLVVGVVVVVIVISEPYKKSFKSWRYSTAIVTLPKKVSTKNSSHWWKKRLVEISNVMFAVSILEKTSNHILLEQVVQLESFQRKPASYCTSLEVFWAQFARNTGRSNCTKNGKIIRESIISNAIHSSRKKLPGMLIYDSLLMSHQWAY